MAQPSDTDHSHRFRNSLRLAGTHPVFVTALCAAIVGGSIGIFGISGWSIGVPLIVIFTVMTIGVAWPRSSLFYPTISHGPRHGNRVALTFDDGPDPEVTPGVLDELAKAGAPATFFVIGHKLARHKELGRRAIAEGHELGNHSWRHSRFQNFRGSRYLQKDIQRASQAINTLNGSATPFYRAPWA